MRRPSIFRRMTGVGLARNGDDLEKTAGLTGDRAAAEPEADHAPRPAAKPQSPLPTAAARPQPAQKATLGGLDPADRLPRTADEDDLLEIPAFLRRQAN